MSQRIALAAVLLTAIGCSVRPVIGCDNCEKSSNPKGAAGATSAGVTVKTISTTTTGTAAPAQSHQAVQPGSQSATGSMGAMQHAVFTPADVRWVDAPPSLPSGAKLAVLEGDPTKPGLFTMRAKFPAGYRIPAHWHPADERVTVISGAFNIGMGDKLDTTKGQKVPAGGFTIMPAKTNHFAWTDEETVIQLNGMGPWQLIYINPADDPRTQQGQAPAGGTGK